MGARGATGYVLGRGAGSAAQWWMAAGVTPVAAYAPKGAASLAASYVNLANPGTYDAAPGVAPTWDAVNGWTGNGTTQYLKTGIIPAKNYTMIVRFSGGASSGNRMTCGSESGGSTTFYICPAFGTNRLYGAGGNAVKAGNLTQGVVGVVTGIGAYLNGDFDVSLGAWSGTSVREIYILAYNAAGAASFFWSGKISSLWIGNTTLSAAAVATQSAAMP